MIHINQIKERIGQDPKVGYAILGVLAAIIIGVVMILCDKPSIKEKHAMKSQGNKTSVDISVSDSEKLEFMKGMQKNYYDVEDRMKTVEDQVRAMKMLGEQIKRDQQIMVESLTNIRGEIATHADQKQLNDPSLELAIAPIQQKKTDDSFVYLPIGSFCKGTLMTGVFASSDLNSPLPVLIKLDEAFYGPNQTRIPLKGAFALGKAIGDINSQRALIQIVSLSFVMPSGKVFEQEQDIGYVTDSQGELGIGGQIVRNTGRALALTFAGGLMSGGASALADREVTTTQGRFGSVERNVTGDISKHAIFAGLAKSAGELSQYYEKQAENIIPAVHIPSGSHIYFIIQKGVRINGFLRRDFNQLAVIN